MNGRIADKMTIKRNVKMPAARPSNIPVKILSKKSILFPFLSGLSLVIIGRRYAEKRT